MSRSSGMFGTGISLNSLQNQDDVNAATDPIIEALYDQNGTKYKQQANKFFDIVLAHLDDGNAPVVSKFYTMMILVQMTEKGQTKILSALSGHALLGFLANFVDITDPRKPVSQKGRQIFPQDPDSGNNFVRISLECIKFWGQKFLKTRNNQPTKFRRALNTLIQKKVVFPEQYIYFKKSPRSDSKAPVDNSQPRAERVEKIEYTQQPQSQPQTKKTSKAMGQLMFTNNQIDGLVSSLENAQQAQDLERNIITYHDKFSKDLQKYKNMQGQIFSTVPYDQQLVNKYLKITQFFNEQQETYKSFAAKGDYLSYKDSILINYEKIFSDGKTSKSNFASGNKLMIPNQVPKFKQTFSQVIPSGKQTPSEQKISRDNFHQQVQPESVIKSMFKNMQQRSKSPGFKGLRESLEKEKRKIITNPPRIARLSPSNINKSQAKSLSKSKSGLRQSKVAAIFSNPPNKTNLRDKIYDGKLVLQNNDLNASLYDLTKQQGMRRFKVSNFREKNPLVENDVLQIGFKSQTVYEQVQSFKGILALELFIGNKTESQIRNFKISYTIDNNQLLYAHPRVVDTIIPAGFQNKHELMFIPLEIPFKLAVAKVQYDYQGQQYRTKIVLPNSILKFAEYRSISKGQLNSSWAKENTFRTVPFQLSHFLPPDGLAKWIPNLEELTRYSEFAESESQTDYELFCGIRIKQLYKGILKINVRPNLKVIVQVCNLERDQQSDKHFRFYLETLQLVMSHAEE